MPASLSEMGLVIDLGHGTQECPAPKDRTPRSMQIIDLFGVFTVRVRFLRLLAFKRCSK